MGHCFLILTLKQYSCHTYEYILYKLCLPVNDFIQSFNFFFVQLGNIAGLKVAGEKHDQEVCKDQPDNVEPCEPHVGYLFVLRRF